MLIFIFFEPFSFILLSPLSPHIYRDQTPNLGKVPTDGGSVPGQWYNGKLFYTGQLGAGPHTVTVTSEAPGAWGCGADWGGMNIMLLGEPNY